MTRSSAGSSAVSSTPPRPGRDPRAEADGRLAGLPAARGAPAAVLEDAHNQLAAMLSGLRELGEAFPLLADPLAPWPAAPTTGGGAARPLEPGGAPRGPEKASNPPSA